MSAMNDLFADLDDDVLSPLDDASTSHTHNNGASRYSLGGDSASASTSTLNHHHHQQLAHHLDQHHHQQQHLHQPLAMDTSASQSMRPGGAAAPPVWMNQDLPSWLSKQQAAPVSFAASAAEVAAHSGATPPIPFSRKRSGEHVLDLQPDTSVGSTRRAPPMNPSHLTLAPELADVPDASMLARNHAAVAELHASCHNLSAMILRLRDMLASTPLPLNDNKALLQAAVETVQLAQWASARHTELLDDMLLTSAELAQLHSLGAELRVLGLQIGIYENELRMLASGEVQADALTCLVIAQQPFPMSVKQSKPVAQSTVLRVLKAARSTIRPLSVVQAAIVTGPSKSKKQQPVRVDGHEVPLDDGTLTASFSQLSFPIGSRLKPVAVKFSLQVELGGIGGNQALALESDVSGELIVKTNENQWDETEGTLLLRATWPTPDTSVTWVRFCNVLQRHYVIATRQQISDPVRALGAADFNYIHKVKFDTSATRVSQKDFKRVWEWFGPYMHRIRYQRHLCQLWHKGLLVGFIDRPQAEALLYSTERTGSFLIRFSERVAGQFAVSYLVRSIDTQQLVVRHYLIKDSDTAGAKKTLPDFLREYKEFAIIIQLQRDANTGRRSAMLIDKHVALEEYYSKKTESAFDGYEDAIDPFS